MSALLYKSKADHPVWGEDALYAARLSNVTSDKSLGGRTPFEKSIGKVRNFSDVRVLGREAHVHVPKEEKRQKLASRSMLEIFVGIEDAPYRIWDPGVRGLVTSKRVSV